MKLDNSECSTSREWLKVDTWFLIIYPPSANLWISCDLHRVRQEWKHTNTLATLFLPPGLQEMAAYNIMHLLSRSFVLVRTHREKQTDALYSLSKLNFTG